MEKQADNDNMEMVELNIDKFNMTYAEDTIDIDRFGVRFYTAEHAPGFKPKDIQGLTLEERLALRFDDVKNDRMSARERVGIALLSLLIVFLFIFVACQIYNYFMFHSASV